MSSTQDGLLMSHARLVTDGRLDKESYCDIFALLTNYMDEGRVISCAVILLIAWKLFFL